MVIDNVSTILLCVLRCLMWMHETVFFFLYRFPFIVNQFAF